MVIGMTRYIRGRAYSNLKIDKAVLEKLNSYLKKQYVIVGNVEETPYIESVEKLEEIIKDGYYNRGHLGDYKVVNKFFLEEADLNIEDYYISCFDLVYELINDYLWDEPVEIDECYDTIDCEIEIDGNIN